MKYLIIDRNKGDFSVSILGMFSELEVALESLLHIRKINETKLSSRFQLVLVLT